MSSTAITSLPGKRNNNLVAESDLHAAFQAVDERVESSLVRAITADNVDQEQLKLLFTSLASSLKDNVQRVTQPVSDEAYHVYMHHQTHDEDGHIPKAVVSSEEQEENDGNNIEFDDEDLVDQDALRRVKELREQVRQEASRLTTIRTQVTDKAISNAQRQAQLWRAIPEADLEQQNKINEEDILHKVQEMHASLNSMSDVLKQTTTAAPQSVDHLQKTLEAIQKRFTSQQSSVDKAILSQDLESKKIDISTMSAEDQLAAFLRT